MTQEASSIMINASDSDKNRKNDPADGLRITSLNYIFIIVLLALTMLLFYISTSQYSKYNEIIQITDEYHRVLVDSRMVQSASDHLTKNVQNFVITGDQSYLDDYFKEANETKQREKAIEDLRQMEEIDFLLTLLEKSVNESMDLMELEYEAMRYGAEGYGLDIPSLPEEIKETVLPDEAASMSDQEKIERSREIVFSKEYSDHKDIISAYESQYMDETSKIMNDLQTGMQDDMSHLIAIFRLSVLVIAFLGIMLFITISRMIVLPLNHAVSDMSEEKKIQNIEGTYEIRYMANAYNEFYEDISEQNKALKIANEKAQAASVAKTNFLFNMSHDLRTPMNAIIGFTNLAERHIDDKEAVKDYLSKISNSSDLLLSLINDVLEMARIENGKAQIQLAPENIIEILEQMEHIVRVQANDKNQELTFENDVKHEYVLCDRLKLNQIAMNLISNAIKYTNENGHILVSLKEEDRKDEDRMSEGTARYILKVKDDGIGMSEEFQKKIFEPFEREKNSTVSRITGTGLGMSITKNLIDLMGGEISLQSAPGKGSEFTVSFDFTISEKTDTIEKGNIVQIEEPAAACAGYRILVVDDNEINRLIATELLKDMGYETKEACDGQEAIDIIKNADAEDFDLILMDIQMPTVNGYEAAKAIRKLDSPLASIPIIALTANAFEDDVRNAEEAGMNGHVAKPINIEQLEKTLTAILHT